MYKEVVLLVDIKTEIGIITKRVFVYNSPNVQGQDKTKGDDTSPGMGNILRRN